MPTELSQQNTIVFRHTQLQVSAAQINYHQSVIGYPKGNIERDIPLFTVLVIIKPVFQKRNKEILK